MAKRQQSQSTTGGRKPERKPRGAAPQGQETELGFMQTDPINPPQNE